MRCPKCNGYFVETIESGRAMARCGVCQGLWLTREQLEALSEQRLELLSSAWLENFERAGEADTEMGCPACEGHNLSRLDVDGLALEFCPSCRGIYVDSEELSRLAAAKALESDADREPFLLLRNVIKSYFVPVDWDKVQRDYHAREARRAGHDPHLMPPRLPEDDAEIASDGDGSTASRVRLPDRSSNPASSSRGGGAGSSDS